VYEHIFFSMWFKPDKGTLAVRYLMFVGSEEPDAAGTLLRGSDGLVKVIAAADGVFVCNCL
jgi:hypothetical protein